MRTLILGALTATFLSTPSLRAAERLNVVFILADDLGWADLGCYGSKDARPELRGFDVNIAGDQAGSPRSYFAPFRGRDGSFMPGLEKAPDGEYLTDRLTAEAEKFIDTNRDRPFFLYLAHYAVHIPLKAKADLIAKYKPGSPGQQGNTIYAAMIERLDESVARVL